MAAGCLAWTMTTFELLTTALLLSVSWSRAIAGNGTLPCPALCLCSGPAEAVRADCSGINLTAVPAGLSPLTVALDLSSNNLSTLPEWTFRKLNNLQELNLSTNRLETLSASIFSKCHKLRILMLQHNKIQRLPSMALQPLQNLEALYLTSNRLVTLPAGGFSSQHLLQRLWLDSNHLMEVPSGTLQDLSRLEALNLAINKLQEVKDYAFSNLTKLAILFLQHNEIRHISLRAFEGLRSLKVLEVNGNKLKKLPEALSSLPSLRELTFADNGITYLMDSSFKNTPQLTLLEMAGNPIASVGQKTFSNLQFLKRLTLSEARQLIDFPDLTGTSSLEHLRLDRARLSAVPADLCRRVPLLKSLILKSNEISNLPVLNSCADLRLLDLRYNLIRSIAGAPFIGQTKLIDLFLGSNLLEEIPPDAFEGLASLQVLELENNKIKWIHPKAFLPLRDLRDLNLGRNSFPHLPHEGLQSVRQLKTYKNPYLKEFPSPHAFPRVQTLALSYAYHCCPFLPLSQQPTVRPSSLQETIVWLTREDVDMNTWNSNITDVWPGFENFSSKFEEFASQLWKALGRDYAIPDNLAQYAEEYFEDYKSVYNSEENLMSRYPIQCLPAPGPFMPCEDLFGWWSLRCGVWVVFLLAMLGNGVVVVVLMFGRSKMDVPRFLVCNLAIADFFMGVYLGILAVVDASTLGEFKVFAIPWQTSAGCQIAGFLGVLSSELSVYTLSVITLERNYAITHAMHLNKRLSLKHAAYIMACGWLFALIMALLPLFGISDYRKFAICLPFETEDSLSLGYVVFLIIINGVAFLILMGCYLKMYCAIRGSQAWNSNDSRIAKRMALLVFTDFVCWAPIAFFSLTAVFGLHLISLEEAKVFTIFVLPLNSCANPFLYAIFTKQFKKDCVLICKRIEESRVTRGIGRGRHSSNFSNRHTPANTNSAAERKSGSTSDTPQCRCHSHKTTLSTAGLLPTQRGWKAWALRYLLCHDDDDIDADGNDYAFTIVQIQRNLERRQKHASSISSENFSSRSDSWRQSNIPLRLLDHSGCRNSCTLHRKPSQDSNMSSSRQDSSTSTFRMSRSSVSSDTSNPARTAFARTPAATSDNVPSVAEKHDSGPKLLRCMISLSREKPKLCRQAAVDDSTPQRVVTRAYQRSPPYGVARTDRLCASCQLKEASPPLMFKSKEMEEKFNCFYNRLAETSHEDSTDVSTSKEEQVLLSTDQSTGADQKGDTNDTLLTDTHPSDDQPMHCGPKIEVNPTSPVIRAMGSGKTNLIYTQDQHLLYVAAENIEESHKSLSLTNIGSSEGAATDSSLKRWSLKSLPAILRSLSSQGSQCKSQRLKVRSHSQLKCSPDKQLPSSRSETIISREPQEEWWSSRTLARFSQDSDNDDLSGDAVRINSERQHLTMTSSGIGLVNSNEDSPLINKDSGQPLFQV